MQTFHILIVFLKIFLVATIITQSVIKLFLYGCCYSSAELETKAKLEKVAEIKRINAQMMGIKSEISKHEDILKEYLLYKKFLERLTPKVC